MIIVQDPFMNFNNIHLQVQQFSILRKILRLLYPKLSIATTVQKFMVIKNSSAVFLYWN